MNRSRARRKHKKRRLIRRLAAELKMISEDCDVSMSNKNLEKYKNLQKDKMHKNTHSIYQQYIDDLLCSPPVESGARGEEKLPARRYVSEAGSEKTEQITQFLDDQNDDTEILPTQTDHTMSEIVYSDQSLPGFLSRPVKIFSTDWAVGDNLYATFDPWSLYMSHPFVIKKIQNYRFFNAKLRVKVMINGNPFYYGRALMSYNPFGFGTRAPTRTLGYVVIDNIERSQRPHVEINPTHSLGGEMLLPWFYPKPLASFTNDLNKIGRITLSSYQRLEHANVSTTPVSVTVLAWCDSINLAGPTNVLRSEAADEYGDGIVSKPAKAVARLSGSLSKVPYIGPYMTATQIGADSISRIASLFGFSRPVSVSPPMKVRHSPMPNLAYSSIEETTEKLTLDPKQGLTIDPKTLGYDKDEMMVSDIAKRESYLTRFRWNPDYADDRILFTSYVLPNLHNKATVDGVPEMHFTPMAYAAQPFHYWRGSITYKFVVATSDYHRGRLRIVYDPKVTSPLYGGAYSRIVDINETREFEVTIGWNREQQWLECKHIFDYSNDINFNPEPVIEFTNLDRYANGILSVYVLNSLTVPNDADTGDKYVNVFVKGGDDLEFAALDGRLLSSLKVSRNNMTSECNYISESKDQYDLTPDDHLAAVGQVKTIPELTLIHFGETFHSIRDILKRYSEFEVVTDPGTPFTQTFIAWRRDIFNFPRPSTSSAGRQNTLISWFSCPYAAWRGGIRYKYSVITGNYGTTTSHNDHVYVIRRDNTDTESESMNDARLIDIDAMNGVSFTNTGAQPTLEFEVPFYRPVRFANPMSFSNVDFHHELVVEGTNFDTVNNPTRLVRGFCAAGEDFSLTFLLSMPILVDNS